MLKKRTNIGFSAFDNLSFFRKSRKSNFFLLFRKMSVFLTIEGRRFCFEAKAYNAINSQNEQGSIGNHGHVLQ